MSEYADLRPEPVALIPFDAGTPQGQRRHPRHPASIEVRIARLERLRKMLAEMDQALVLETRGGRG